MKILSGVEVRGWFVKCQCSFCYSEKVYPRPSLAPESKVQSLSLTTWQAKPPGQWPKPRVAHHVGLAGPAGNLETGTDPSSSPPELSGLRDSLIETGGLGDGHDDMMIT